MRTPLADRRISRRLVAAATGWWLLTCLPAQIPAHATVLNPTTFQWRPTLVQQGDLVHAFAFGTTTLLHARSTDGGRTWPLREQPLGPFATNLSPNTLYEVPVVARPGDLLVLGHDAALGPQLVRSLDGGATWAAPVAITTTVVPQANPLLPGMHVDGATIVVAWTNNRPNGRVFCNRSTDGGATWQPNDTQLDAGVPPSSVALSLHVYGSGSTVHVVWYDGVSHRQRSVDGGLTWLPAAATLPGSVGQLVGNGSTLLLLSGNGVLRSTDAGDTWTTVNNHGLPAVWGLAMDGNLVVVAGGVFLVSYHANVSTDGGATWQPSPLVLPAATPTAAFPFCHATGGAAYVHWDMGNNPGIVTRTDDGGASWQAIAGPVQLGFSPGNERTIHATATFISGNSFQYAAYAGVGSTLLGTGTAGSGAIVPKLATNGLPVQGRSTSLQVTDVVGGTPGVIGFSFAPPVAVPFLGATVYLGTLDVLIGVAAGGSPGQPGAGSAAMPLAIPIAPTLVGTSLVAQAMVLDPGVAIGFAVTNAIELWLR